MELIGKIFGLGVIITVADMLLAQAGRKDIAFAVTIVGVVIGLTYAVVKMNELFDTVTTLFGF